MDTECIFCRMATGEIPVDLVYDEDDIIAFHDINPQAPVHLLVVPRRHAPTLRDLARADEALAGRLMAVSTALGEQEAQGRGYRIVVNTGADANQTVGHVHVHVLAGRPMSWPPG